VREFEALAPMEDDIAHRTLGGTACRWSGRLGGKAGANLLNGQRLASKTTLRLVAGDILRLETPGGGGWERTRFMTWFLILVCSACWRRRLGSVSRGGAVVIIPGLVLIAKLPAAYGAMERRWRRCSCPSDCWACLEYSKRQQVHWGYAAVVAVGLLIGAYFGARLAGIDFGRDAAEDVWRFLLLISVKHCS